MSLADVDKLIEQREAVAFIAASNGLTPAQTALIRRLVKTDAPADPAAYALATLGDLGLLKSAQPAPQATTIAATTAPVPPPGGPQQPPISDKGSPVSGNSDDFERRLLENPLGVTAADKQRLVEKHGVEKANRMIVDAVRSKGDVKVQFFAR